MTEADSLSFVVEGGRPLSGSVTTNRSKNGAVALLAASLLNAGTTTFRTMPMIEEVHRLVEVLRSLGVVCTWQDHDLVVAPPKTLSLEAIDAAAAKKTRSILMFIGALIHHADSFSIPQSGGCDFGARTVRPHLWALEKFGVTIETDPDRFSVRHGALAAAEIVLLESSDTATENALIAAARIPGTTVIKYASANYQVQELCGYLRDLGVAIDGIGTTTLTIRGVERIEKDLSYSVAEDPTDAMFFIAASIMTDSALEILRAPIEFLEIELGILAKMGLRFTLHNPAISENGITKLADIRIEPSTLAAFPEKIHARPYPGLNIDNLPFFAAIATKAAGTTTIHDWTFEKRAVYYTELEKLGATTRLLDPHRIEIDGPMKLHAAEVVAPPALRPATVLLVAMLAADGTSRLKGVYSINRGYEDLATRLSALGASVTAVDA